MARILFALFSDDAAARRAMDALSRRSFFGRIQEVQTHDGEQLTHQMKLVETEARRGLAMGLGVGAVGGAIAGGLLAMPLGLPVVLSVLVNGTLGALLGSVGGAIVGAAEPRRGLIDLAEEDVRGDTVLSIRTTDRSTATRVRRMLERFDVVQMREVSAAAPA